MRSLPLALVLALAAAACGTPEVEPGPEGPPFEAIHIVSFPPVEVGDSVQATVAVRAGGSPIFFEPIVVAPPFFSDLNEVEKLEAETERAIVFTFVPTEAGAVVQEVEVRTSGSSRRYRLQAEASPAREPCEPAARTDGFEDIRPVQDVLLVLDDHRSMEAVREELVRQVGALPARLDELGIDWRLAATTTSIGGDCLGGTLLGGGPIAPADLEAALRTEVCDGNGAGLAAASMAIGQGFLRPHAGLSLVFVSTRDDRSPGEVQDHTAAIQQLARPGLARALAVSGEPGGKCSLAEPGARYAEAVQILGGQKTSLCAADWGVATFFSGQPTFGMPLVFALEALPFDEDRDGSIVPAKGEIAVRIDGVEVAAGGDLQPVAWTYDAAANAVVFQPTTAPAPGQTLEIDYREVCFNAASVRSTSPSSL